MGSKVHTCSKELETVVASLLCSELMGRDMPDILEHTEKRAEHFHIICHFPQ